MSALRELLAVFKIDVEAEELEKASKKVSGFVDYLKTVGPVLAEAFAVRALTEFVGETIEAGARVVDLSNRLGLGTQELQQFQFAARTAGVESEAAAHSLGFLNRSVGEAVTGGGEAAATFAKLHVALKDAHGQVRSTGDILNDVSDAIAKLPDQQVRAAYTMKLFGREGQQLLPVLAGGSAGLAKLREEFEELGGGMSQEFVENAKKADDAIAGLKVGMQSLKSRIVGAMLPAIESFTNAGKRWIKTAADWLDHTTLLEHGLKLLAIASGVKLTTTLLKLARVFGLLKPSILQTLVALFEFAVPIALVGLFVLLIEDLWTAIEGGDSVIGDMLTSLGGVEGKNQFVQDLIDSWNELKQIFSIFDGWDPLAMVAATIKFLVGAFYELVETTKLVLDTLSGIGKVAGAGLFGILHPKESGKTDSAGNKELTHDFSVAGQFWDQLKTNVGKDVGAIINPGQVRDHPAAQTVPSGDAQVGKISFGDEGKGSVGVGAISYGAPAVPQSVAGHTVNQTITIPVTVQGSKDAKATGKSVGQGAASELEKQHYRAAQALQAG